MAKARTSSAPKSAPASVPRRKPKNARSKRAMQAKMPVMVEGAKQALVLRAVNTSAVINKVQSDLYAVLKPHAKKLSKRNQTRPFEDQGSLEFLSRVNDCGTFCFGSHSKKRPHNLVLGRTFDSQVLDMFELGVDEATFRSIEQVQNFRESVVPVGMRPAFVFLGDAFETDEAMARFKNLVLDFFRGDPMEQYNLAALTRVIVCTCTGEKVLFRHYSIALKKSGTKVPTAALAEVGPRLDLQFRRRIEAAEEVQTAARRKAKMPKPVTSRKNVEKGKLGQTLGRVHMERQELSQLALSRMKGLRKEKPPQPVEEQRGE